MLATLRFVVPCTWSQWIKKCELPKEVENYCETVICSNFIFALCLKIGPKNSNILSMVDELNINPNL